MGYRSQTEAVLSHLVNNGSITSWEAIENYGCTRLSSIIFNLRTHHLIQTKMVTVMDRFGHEKKVAVYYYIAPIKDTIRENVFYEI